MFCEKYDLGITDIGELHVKMLTNVYYSVRD